MFLSDILVLFAHLKTCSAARIKYQMSPRMSYVSCIFCILQNILLQIRCIDKGYNTRKVSFSNVFQKPGSKFYSRKNLHFFKS